MSMLERVEPAGDLGSPTANTLPTLSGWFDDPEAQHRLRYFDGHRWTDHVTHFGPTPCSGCG